MHNFQHTYNGWLLKYTGVFVIYNFESSVILKPIIATFYHDIIMTKCGHDHDQVTNVLVGQFPNLLSFFFQTNDLSLNEQPSIKTRNEDSTAYPGNKKVTCDLRMPVAGNRGGAYQFRVEISPTNMLGNLSTHVTTPTVNLSKELRLYSISTNIYHL